jgi:hypothetical protein
MALFRRKSEESEPRGTTARPPAEFVGIALPMQSPYELETEAGVTIRLHDMNFLGFDYRADPPTLTMRFVYDPEWTPPDAVATPVAVYRFDGIRIWQWEDDDPPEAPAEVRRQVSDLSYYESTNVFALETPSTRLLFSADKLTVATEPRTDG